MAALYVASSEPYAGKTLTGLTLGIRWLRQGLRVGYLKPLGHAEDIVNGVPIDGDARFTAEQLGIAAPFSQLCPIILQPELCHNKIEVLRELVVAAFQIASKDRDITLIGGLGSFFSRGSAFGLSGRSVAEMLDTKVLFLAPADSFLVVDSIVAAHDALGDRLVGIILNRVPPTAHEIIKQEVIPCLDTCKVPLLGLIPDDPVLSSVSISEIARVTGARFLCCEEAMGSLVESFVIGAMSAESALQYFRRAVRKCVVTGGDRTDIQLVALETPTRCLILTGHLEPSVKVITRAMELGVPVLLAPGDTLSTIDTIERSLGKQRVREKIKMDHALELFERNLNLNRLDATLGLD